MRLNLTMPMTELRDKMLKAIERYPDKDVSLYIVNIEAVVERLQKSLNTPELHDFIKGVPLEAAHQRERWGTSHDDKKEDSDWFWLLGYLAGKALAALKVGDTDKAKHHIITTAAACANWHASVKTAEEPKP